MCLNNGGYQVGELSCFAAKVNCGKSNIRFIDYPRDQVRDLNRDDEILKKIMEIASNSNVAIFTATQLKQDIKLNA